MRSTSVYASIVESAIKELGLDSRFPHLLYAPAGYALEGGGKRLRPVMLMMAAEAFGRDAMSVARQAAGVEMFHNFTLVHDDVMDRSDLRRGRETVQKRWGESTAILSGDAMLTLASELICPDEDAYLRKILRVFNRMALDVYEGQCLDMEFEMRPDVTLDEYVRMTELKTGALLGGSAQIGALLAGASDKDAQAMYEYGRHLGVAFQIQDDYLDVYGDAATFGKPIGGDILNNKKTYLLLTAFGKDNSGAFREAMKLEPSAIKVKTVTNLYTRMNIAEDCHSAVAAYSAIAMKAIKHTDMSEEGRESFRALKDKLLGRNK